jgi:hypothetical protein
MKEECQRINLECFFYVHASIFPLSIEIRISSCINARLLAYYYTDVIYWREFILTEITKYSLFLICSF